jgi:hypothetical protein
VRDGNVEFVSSQSERFATPGSTKPLRMRKKERGNLLACGFDGSGRREV